MVEPSSTWGDLEPFYKCGNCSRKANDLILCPDCKTARYCNEGCLKGNRVYHEKYCHPHGKLPWGETPLFGTLNGAVDPARISNPFRLRSQPALTTEALNALRSYDGPPPPEGHTWGHAKLTAELKKRPGTEAHFRAEEWSEATEEKKGDLLFREKSKEELVRLLREWVYERTKNLEEDKAFIIASQTYEFAQNVDTLEPADLPKREKAHIELSPAFEMAKKELDGAWASDGKGKTSTLGKIKQKAKDVLHLGTKAASDPDDDTPEELRWLVNVPMYQGARAIHMSHYASWLHASLLEKLPPDHDYSRFEGARLTPDNEIIATLLELRVPGIDEGSFWENEATWDTLVLGHLNREQLNEQGKNAMAKLKRKAKRYGVEDKIKPPECLTDEWAEDMTKKATAEENILVRE